MMICLMSGNELTSAFPALVIVGDLHEEALATHHAKTKVFNRRVHDCIVRN